MPYCCVRLPTGGGKTLLGAHAVKVAADRYVERERPLVLWLTPSETIAEQTIGGAQESGASLSAGARRRLRRRGARARHKRAAAGDPPQDFADKVLVFVGTHQAFNVREDRRPQRLCRRRNVRAAFPACRLPPGLAINEGGKRAGKVDAVVRQPAALASAGADPGRSAQFRHRPVGRSEAAAQPVVRHRIHRDAQARIEHDLQRDRPRAARCGHDQAADHHDRAPDMGSGGRRRAGDPARAGGSGGERSRPLHSPDHAVSGATGDGGRGSHGR